ncbi:fibronectin type III domain-containing protein [Leucobacter sp.]
MQNRVVRRPLGIALAFATIAALVGSSLLITGSPGWTAPQQHSQTFGYTGSTTVWTVPSGVRSVQVEIRGGQGGNGGDDAAGAPAISTYRGVITGTLEVAPGQALTVAVGSGGATGASSAQGSAAGPAGGNNPLPGYNGGTGGKVGTAGSSGQGGGGGAASVLQVAGQDIVAGGGGGNGGSGQYAPTRGRVADSVFVPRTDAVSTDGQVGLQPSGGNNDGGGSGGGGGGAQGGAQGRVEFGAGTSTEWFGYGGSVGQNSTASFTTLSAGYEHLAQNTGHGSIVLRWVTGVAAAPAAPQGVAGIGEVDLYWDAPTEIGQGPITDYRVQFSANGGTTWSDAPSVGSATAEQTVTGLSNGTAYVFRVAAVTPAGIGDYSPPSQPLTPFALPSAPTITSVDPLDGALSVGFTAPATGAPPTGYQYRIDGGAWVPVAGTGQPITISGLSNGTPYSVEIRATSGVGAGAASAPENGTPRAVPGAPTVTGVVAGVGTGTVSFTAGFDGGSPITGYEYRLDGGSWQTIGSGTSPLALSGLGDATATAVEIRAVNAVGAGAPSAPITVTTPDVPGALVDAAAVGLDRAVSVDFALGTTGGSPITGVEISLDGGASWSPAGLSGPITIPGLVNGTEQSVRLRAVNAVGAGPATTVAATPATVPGAPGIASVDDNGAGALEVAFTPPAQDGGSPITGYEYSTDGGLSWAAADGGSSPLTITQGSDGGALDPETVYPVALRAVNGAGAGPASSAVNTLGPVPPVLAGPPTITAVVSQPGALAVEFTPGDNGGETVTEYQYSVDGGASWSSTGSLSGRFVIGGLADGTSYPVLVRAVTSAGDGASSAPVSGTPASAPGAPTLTALQRGDGQLTVEATLGGSGGSPVTDLEYTLDGGSTWHPTGLTEGPVTISGLNNGQSVTVQLRARNAVGVSGGSNPLTASPAAAPPQPALTLTPGDTTVAVAASFPSDGGAPLTRIEYSLDGGSTWLDTGSLSGALLLTGRANGTPVEVRLRGVNAIGAGAVAVETATPRTVPGPPTDVVTVGNTSSVEVAWQAPADDGGSPITGYTAYAYSSPSSTTPVASCTSTGAQACTIPGLANGTTYFVAVAAKNAAGTGPESVRRPSAMPLVRPGAPNLTAVTAGDQRLTLTFAAGTAGDRPIQRYEYTVDGGTTWLPLGTGSPANVSGLVNGTLYSAQVRAVSEAGPGPASNARTGTPYGYPFAPTNIVATPGSGSAAVTWSPADLNGTALSRYAVTLFNAQSGGAVVAGPVYTTGTSHTFTGLANGTTYYASIQTEATAPVGGTLYSERSDPRVPVTPNQAGTPPTFGTPTRTADGYTVTITNYQASSSYTLNQAGLPAGASATRSGGTITVTGLAPGAGGTVGVTVTRSGFTPATAAVMGTALNAGVEPQFGAPVPTVDGYTVQITNFDAAASYSTSGLASGAAATVGATGLVTVTGVAPGATQSVTVRAAKTGSVDGVGSTQGTALAAALQPSFGTPTRTADGFTVQITNYDAAFAWSAATSTGSATVNSSGLVTVTGIVPGGAASVTVGTSRAGYAEGSRDVSGSALEAALSPAFGAVTRTADGFTVQIANYDAAFAWSAAAPGGAASVSASGLLTVTGLDAGSAATATVETSRAGYLPGSGSVSGQALGAGAAPEFGTPSRTASGYTVRIENFDADASYALDTSELPAGATATRAGDTITVIGLLPGASGEVGATVSKAGFTNARGSVTGAALETGAAPVFGTPTRTVDGYTVVITDYQSLALYVLDPTALPAGASATLAGDTITVTGLAAGAAGELAVTVTRPGFTPASGSVSGAALETGAAPVFGAPVRTADGYTVLIENFDADAAYTLDGSELPAGASAVRSGDTITVTGLAPGERGEVGVTVSKAGSTDASETVAGTALETGVAPVFGTPVRTADGYTVLIGNFDADAEYEFSVPAGVTAAVDGSGLVTVNGVDPGAEATLEATVSRGGFTDASGSVSGTALETGVAPVFGTPVRTADGYTVVITNLDPDAVYALDESTLPAGASAARSGDTITVTGLAAGATGAVGVTASRADRTDASATATGTALEAALVPEFGTVNRTADGYSVQIVNHDPAFDWSVAASHGDVAIDASGLVTVTGLDPGAAATVTAETSRTGYVSGSREVSGTALETGAAPVFGAPTRTVDGYTVRIENFDPDADYALDASALPAGAAASRAGDTITVTGLAPGASGEVGVTASKTGYADAASPVTGTALETGIAPAFGPVTRTAQGFTVEITNFDPAAEYLVAVPPGTTARLVGSTLVVTGLAPGKSSTIDVRVQLPGSTEAAGSVTGTAQQAGSAPKLSKPRPTADGFEVTILDYDPSLEYTVTVTHGTVKRVGALIVVTGLEPGQEAVLTVTASNADTAAGTQAVAGAAAAAPGPGEEPEAPGTTPGGGLAGTGAAGAAPIGLLAALLLLAGAGLVVRRRRV